MGVSTNSVAGAYAAQSAIGKDVRAKQTEETKEASGRKKTTGDYGKTIGEPKLSEKAQKYYDQLKKKYGNYDFILVSEDQKENAKANASKYANSFKTVVLIDEAKIEKMATDEKFRKQYEGILSGASSKLQQMKADMEKSGANVKGFGMQVNDNGTASYFAVLKKSSADQKERIEKKALQKKTDRKAEKKKEEIKQAEKRAEKHKKTDGVKKSDGLQETNHPAKVDDEETVTISANSIEELMKKIGDYRFLEMSDNVQTESEKQVGQFIDFKG